MIQLDEKVGEVISIGELKRLFELSTGDLVFIAGPKLKDYRKFEKYGVLFFQGVIKRMNGSRFSFEDDLLVPRQSVRLKYSDVTHLLTLDCNVEHFYLNRDGIL